MGPQKQQDNVAAVQADSVLQRPAGSRRGRTPVRRQEVATPADAARAPSLPAGARRAALPATLAPQLATLVAQPPSGAGWHYEIKFDGYRILARIDGGDVRLFTRNSIDWSQRLPGVVDAVHALKLGEGWLDGEIVVADADGVPDFNALQNAFDVAAGETVEYVAFDLPYFAGHDMRSVPLAHRRELLRRLLDAQTIVRVRFSQDFDADATPLLRDACRVGLEGIIGKHIDAPYVSRRSPTWIKLKCNRRQEFVVGGYTDPKGQRSGIGSLLLGLHDESGEFVYAGAVGSGFDVATLRTLQRTLAGQHSDECPFDSRPRVSGAHWVRPTRVVEVSFAEWTRAGRIRHPVFHGLRDDKPAAAITRERALSGGRVDAATAPSRGRLLEAAKQHAPAPPARAAGTGPSQRGPVALPKGLRISHPRRIIDSQSGATKADLVEHYVEAARAMLPHLAKRPVTLVRAPAGVAGPTFVQRHAQRLNIAGLKSLGAASGFEGMIEIAAFDALAGAAQANVVEFHTWNATTRQPAKPDRLVFDLDPGEGLDWQAMLEGAELTRSALAEFGLQSFLKTSGGKGLHLVVPIRPLHPWELVKAVTKGIVERLAAVAPDRFVARSGAAHRVGKIFVDHLRNAYGATTACAWSVRARPGLGVSVPCAWDELSSLRSGSHWTLGTVRERLQEKDDPWAGYAQQNQSLAKARRHLGV